eukprot:scaffold6396_cov72-Phaeocystis_antarctica.AAC.1
MRISAALLALRTVQPFGSARAGGAAPASVGRAAATARRRAAATASGGGDGVGRWWLRREDAD